MLASRAAKLLLCYLTSCYNVASLVRLLQSTSNQVNLKAKSVHCLAVTKAVAPQRQYVTSSASEHRTVEKCTDQSLADSPVQLIAQ